MKMKSLINFLDENLISHVYDTFMKRQISAVKSERITVN